MFMGAKLGPNAISYSSAKIDILSFSRKRTTLLWRVNLIMNDSGVVRVLFEYKISMREEIIRMLTYS